LEPDKYFRKLKDLKNTCMTTHRKFNNKFCSLCLFSSSSSLLVYWTLLHTHTHRERERTARENNRMKVLEEADRRKKGENCGGA
jgi:hypothetical protein